MALLKRKRRRPVRRTRSERPFRTHLLRVVVVLCALGLLYGAWCVVRLPLVSISSVTVVGGETLSHEDIRALVERQLDGHYAFLIPKRFTYFYPQQDILQSVRALPRVREAHVERTSRTDLRVSLTEHIPHGLWCSAPSETPEEPSVRVRESRGCLFLSREGHAFASAPTLTGAVLTRHVTESETPEIGNNLRAPAVMREIEAFINALHRELNFRIGEVTHTADGDVIYHINGAGDLLASPDMTAQETFDNLRSVLASEQYVHLSLGSFQYIDLRFGERIFINEEPIPPASATTSDETLDVE